MAALVASPLASPLNSPRSAPNFQKGPAETSALVDGLLTAWEEQQSRSPAIDQCFRFHEPTSFPFPVIADPTPTIGTAPDDPCTIVSQGGEFSTLDFDVLFHGLDQTSSYSGHDYNLVFSGISEAHVFNDDVSTSRPACLETAYTEEKTQQEFVTTFGASWVEIETQDLQPMEVESSVHIPKSPFGVSADPTQTIKWDAGTHRSSFALQAEAPLRNAPPFSFGFSPELNYTSSSIPFVSTILTPSADLHECEQEAAVPR
ncbi:hypothetical protein BU23DRAFT_188673 [Bimuria novae-zelandiae CBS 107.79]|uniref:Uncharacterized protein n=1 Tax=Bimuria novae-zelandiae CBS 107.79 TaxID=1447943 RepID=A0A6A5VNG2_9PLEO|nr:hypothetical protein BU23DRAFT_188673 [Bimuria novae-zelandiae CBS 107.79]